MKKILSVFMACCILVSLFSFSASAESVLLTDFEQDWNHTYGKWDCTGGEISLIDVSDGGWAGTGNFYLDFKNQLSDNYTVSFGYHRPTSGGDENQIMLVFDGTTPGSYKVFALQWGENGIWMNNRNFIAGAYSGYSTIDYHHVTITVSGGVVTASITNGETKSMNIADIADTTDAMPMDIRFRSTVLQYFDIENLVINDIGNSKVYNYGDESQVSFTNNLTQAQGAWNLSDQGVISHNRTGGDSFGNMFLNVNGAYSDYTLQFRTVLPSISTDPGQRNAVTNYVYDAVNNRYTFATLYYGLQDCFAIGHGMEQQWVAGAWCAFGETKEYDLQAVVSGTTVVYTIGDYSATVDLSGAVWEAGKPATNIQFTGLTTTDYQIKNLKLITNNAVVFDYTNPVNTKFVAQTGTWLTKMDGSIVLQETDANWYYLNYVGEKMQKVSVSFLTDLPKSTDQGLRYSYLFNVYNPDTNKFIPVTLLVGYMDCALVINGNSDLLWIAGSWCNFGRGTSKVKINVTIDGTVFSGSIAGYPFSYDIATYANAAWIDGNPGIQMTVASYGETGCEFSNYSVVNNRVAYDVNVDNVFDVRDLVRLKKAASGAYNYLYYADYDNSGANDSVDLIHIRQHLMLL